MDYEYLKQSFLEGWSNIHPDLFTYHHPDKYYSDLLETITTPHPHVRIVTNFVETNIFKGLIQDLKIENLSWQETRELKMEPLRQRMIEIDQIIFDQTPETLTPNHLLPYVEILSEHIIAQGYHSDGKIANLCRFGSHKLCRSETKDVMYQVLEDMIEIHKHQDDLETGGYRATSTWHQVMTSSWAFMEGNFREHTKFILETLLALNEKLQSNFVENTVFEYWKNKTNYSKPFRSTYSAMGPFYASIGETERALELFKKSRDLFGTITGYVEETRVVEHAIEVYKLEPTEENKLKAIELFIKSKRLEAYEPTELVRESAIIALMMLQDIYKVTVT